MNGVIPLLLLCLQDLDRYNFALYLPFTQIKMTVFFSLIQADLNAFCRGCVIARPVKASMVDYAR
jgi:hypothetical protein